MRYTVKPQQVCSTSLSFDLEGDVVTNVEFVRGCDGNLKAISKLVDGMTVDKLESILRGNTSCADQLAIAVREKYEESKQAQQN